MCCINRLQHDGLSLSALNAQVSLKAFLMVATHLISGESFYTVDDINKLFCTNLLCFLEAHHWLSHTNVRLLQVKAVQVKGKPWLL